MRVGNASLGVVVPGHGFGIRHRFGPRRRLIGTAGVGDFVGGSFAVPTVGMGDFVPGWFAVPQNPVLDGMGDMVGSGPMGWAIPYNSVMDNLEGDGSEGGSNQSLAGLHGGSSCGGGCGCGGSCGCESGVAGLGDLTADFNKFKTDLTAGNYMTALQDPFMSVPAWAWAAGIVVVGSMFLGRKRR